MIIFLNSLDIYIDWIRSRVNELFSMIHPVADLKVRWYTSCLKERHSRDNIYIRKWSHEYNFNTNLAVKLKKNWDYRRLRNTRNIYNYVYKPRGEVEWKKRDVVFFILSSLQLGTDIINLIEKKAGGSTGKLARWQNQINSQRTFSQGVRCGAGWDM